MEQITIQESNMTFGAYSQEDVFQIEKSKIYKELQDGGSSIKTVEFILLKKKKQNQNLLFVEAKTSTANYATPNTSEEKKKKQEEFIQEITQKWTDSIRIYCSLILKRIHSSELSEKLSTEEVVTGNFVPILVVKNGYKASLIPLRDLLLKKLEPARKIWNIQNILVLNEEQARERHLLT